jgi:hypothetical protein
MLRSLTLLTLPFAALLAGCATLRADGSITPLEGALQ